MNLNLSHQYVSGVNAVQTLQLLIFLEKVGTSASFRLHPAPISRTTIVQLLEKGKSAYKRVIEWDRLRFKKRGVATSS